MAQTQILSKLSIDTSFATGQLSLHEYRKFLSRQETNTNMSPPGTSPRRTLKRKQAALNLYQCQTRDHHSDFSAFNNMQSPVSSAPSSPPPLSFCQSVVSLPGDIPTPISPGSLSMVRPVSRYASSTHSSAAQRMDPFSARLRKPKQYYPSHSRTSSDLTLPSSAGGGLTLTINHNGTEFEILNPRDSLFNLQKLTRYRSSEDIMEREDSSGSVSPSRQSFMTSSNPIPDDMVRPISASESAVLSKKLLPPLPIGKKSPGLLDVSESLVALPPVEETPSTTPTSAGPRSSPPKTPGRTLKQKVSRLFGVSSSSSPVEASTTDHEKHSPHHRAETGGYKISHPILKHREDGKSEPEPHTPSPRDWLGDPMSVADLFDTPPYNHPQQPADQVQASVHDSNQEAPGGAEGIEFQTRRRPTWGPHSANRHQTLQDALRQMETENHGLSFDDIMRYIGSNSDSGYGYTQDQEQDQGHNAVHEQAPGSSDEHGAVVERPWQPDTWQEPSNIRMPQNRPSDSNLSTNAPSTHASIRPYAERAAAFMASSDASSISSIQEPEMNIADEADEDHEDDHQNNSQGHVTIEDNAHELTTLPRIRRVISNRARPLSSNPPDLDTPIIPASPSSNAGSTADTPTATATANVTLATPTPRPISKISWSPEIPKRHPDHRFADDIPARPATPPPPPQVVTTIIRPRKQRKKHSTPCYCL